MDVQMPNMGGLEAARRIKQALPSVGVLFVSGDANLADESVAADGGGFLAKPFEPEKLYSEVTRVAAKSRPEGG